MIKLPNSNVENKRKTLFFDYILFLNFSFWKRNRISLNLLGRLKLPEVRVVNMIRTKWKIVNKF